MKKKIIKIVLGIFALFLVGVIGLLVYLKTAFPKISPASNLKVESTQERIKRGEYLANAVCACMDCHSKRDWSKFSGPLQQGTFGGGGEIFDESMGLPGTFTSKNITPFALKNWTDGEIFRAITAGVNKEGKALFPIMPYLNYGKMDKEDIYSIIAYLRSIPEVQSTVAASSSKFPMNFIINTIPTDGENTARPDTADKLKYGQYLVHSGSCADCHTQQKKGSAVPGMQFAGGMEFKLGPNTVRSANITSDKETGIGHWTESQFVTQFRKYADSTFVPVDMKPEDKNTIMPWMMYGHLKESDLKAMYAYLMTVSPVKNKVEKWSK